MEKLEPFAWLLGMSKVAATVEKGAVVHQKINLELRHDPVISLWNIPAEVLKPGTQTDVCTHMFMAPWFTITKRWKQPECPSADDGHTGWFLPREEYYSVLKRKVSDMLCNLHVP